LALRLKRLQQRKKNFCYPKFYLQVLSEKVSFRQFEVEVKSRFLVLDEDNQDSWESLRDSLQERARNDIGLNTTSKHDWISVIARH